MRAAIYLRQSQDRSGEQHGIERQREDALRLITSRGWTVAAEFVDNDVSATSLKPRPQFDRMMAGVDAGEFDVVVARHMDRLLRRLSDFVAVLERTKAAKAFVVTAADGVDTSTDGGRLVAGILASVAEGEVERKSARQKSAYAQAAQQGRWIGGRRAFGFEPDGVTIREPEAELIRQAYADVLSGETLSELARRWNASGLLPSQGKHPWTRSTVREVLTNPRHAGLRRHRSTDDIVKYRRNPELGIVGKAEWPPIVPESTWRAAVRVMCDPSRTRRPLGGKGLLTGVAVCGVCGLTVHRGGAAHGLPMYRCSGGRHVSRKSEPIDEYVTAVVLERLMRADAAELWAAELPDAAELMAEADTLRRRRDDIAADYGDGAMTREQFRTANTRVLGRLAEVEARIAAAGTASPLAIVAANDVAAAWEALSTAQRRNIIAALCVPEIQLVGAGVRTFRPESVTFRWRDRPATVAPAVDVEDGIGA